jgi:WD40 repeat protein
MSYTDHESNSICNPWSSCLATRSKTGNKHVQLITVQKPMYVSRSSEGYLTTGCWSPTRPAVIYIGLIDGTIEVWDLLDQSHQPSMTALVSSCQLTSMEFWKLSTPQFLAVGDIQGILHIMEIPRILRRASYKEV